MEDPLRLSQSVELVAEKNSQAPTSAQSSYIQQWINYFENSSLTNGISPTLKEAAMNGKLRNCHFRSTCWQLFLECLPASTDYWESTLKKSREVYNIAKKKHMFNPSNEQSNVQFDNPLSLNEQSNWSRYFKSNDIKAMIERDVNRTCPEIDYFHKNNVRHMLCSILFTYACEYPQISYKQGIHELVAPLLFVLHCDLQAFQHAKELGDLPEIFSIVLDSQYIEHDAYTMLVKLMESTHRWFAFKNEEVNLETNDSTSICNKTLGEGTEDSIQTKTPPLVITKKLDYIHNTLLKQFDNELYLHFEKLQIIPQVYGLRWIRLLFGREFVLQDLLVLWDALFVDSKDLLLVDYIFVAMLVNIRHKLLQPEYCEVMKILMKYPNYIDIHELVQLALHFRNPTSHMKPVTLLTKFEQSHSDDSFVNQQSYDTSMESKHKSSFLPNLAIDKKLISSFKSNMKSFMQSTTSNLSLNGSTKNEFQSFVQVQSNNNGNTNEPIKNRTPSFNKINVMKNLSNMFDQNSSSTTKTEKDIEKKVMNLQLTCKFCSDQIDDSIKSIQKNLTKLTSSTSKVSDDVIINESSSPVITSDDDFETTTMNLSGEILMSLASLKQIRDVLRGNLTVEEFVRSQNLPKSPSIEDLTQQLNNL